MGEAVLSCYAMLGQHWTHCRADKSTSIESTAKTDCSINLLYTPSFKEHNGQHTSILWLLWGFSTVSKQQFRGIM